MRCELAEIFWSTIYKLGRRLKKMMRSRKHATLEGFVWLANRAADVRTQLVHTRVRSCAHDIDSCMLLLPLLCASRSHQKRSRRRIHVLTLVCELAVQAKLPKLCVQYAYTTKIQVCLLGK